MMFRCLPPLSAIVGLIVFIPLAISFPLSQSSVRTSRIEPLAMARNTAVAASSNDTFDSRKSRKTVLVTGGSGYIAKHVILQLLDAGHSVKTSMRSKAREQELRDALAPYLDREAVVARMQVTELDLMSETGWMEAMENIDVLMHIASPCPSKEPKNEEEVIRPAVDGALRAVKSAHNAGVTRVICTSSVAAVVNAQLPNERSIYDETDWTNVDKPGLNAYVKSKTLAERAVWQYQEMEAPELKMTTILPSFVIGAPLDNNYGSSIQKIERLLTSATPEIQNFGYSCVDVRDIALMHLRAMERPDASIGKRFIGTSSGRFMWIPEMAQILSDAYPDRNISTKSAPSWLIRLKALYDPSLRYVAMNLDRRRELSNAQSRELLGIDFRDAKDSLLETADYLVKHKLAYQSLTEDSHFETPLHTGMLKSSSYCS